MAWGALTSNSGIDKAAADRLRGLGLSLGVDCRSVGEALGPDMAVVIAHLLGRVPEVGVDKDFVHPRFADVCRRRRAGLRG